MVTDTSTPFDDASPAPVAINLQLPHGKQLLIACAKELRQLDEAAAKEMEQLPPLEQMKILVSNLKARRRSKINLDDFEAGIAIQTATPQQQIEVVLAAAESLVKDKFSDLNLNTLCHQLLNSLLRRKLPYTQKHIQKMLNLLILDSNLLSELPVTSMLSNIERCAQADTLSKGIRDQLNKLSKTYHPEAYCASERRIGERFRRLLNCGDSVESRQTHGKTNCNQTPASDLDMNTGEAWTNALQGELQKLHKDAYDDWLSFLQHCRSAKASKPSNKWLKQAKSFLEPIGHDSFVRVISPALASIGKPGACQKFNHGGQIFYGEETQIHDTHVNMLRGILWSTSQFNDQELISLLGDVAEKCFQKIREIGPRCPKTGNACLVALSALASEDAVGQLGRLKSRAKHVSTRKQIERAFERAAKLAGMSAEDLEEIGVPRFGMTEPGRLEQRIGNFTASVCLHANQKARLTWLKDGAARQKSVPSEVKSRHADELKALKKKLKDIDTLMPSIRFRVENLFLQNRDWSLADFRSRFLDHPLVGVVARNLIWNASTENSETPVFLHQEKFVDADGKPVQSISEGSRISLWHPMHSEADVTHRWRKWLLEHGITQPFKQAHREIYALTDAERETDLYSNRFAAHIILQHQFAALCQQRAWRYDLQGDWDSWNLPYLDLHQHELRVEFMVQPLDGLNEVTENFVYTHLSTDQVRFSKLVDPESDEYLSPIPLDEIQPLIFSEAMRDVDLFVGVCSVGNDPNWHLNGNESPYTDYWRRYSFGALSQTAATRKQVLQELLPKLEIAGRCRIEDRFLVVEGKLRTYKIHFGSGNILMSPNDQYLCIVQKRGGGTKRTDNVYLPFEGDNTLSLILSKAFLLADDDRIKDTTITNQIRLEK